MASNYPTVYYGSYGETVKQLQQALNQVGYSLDVDGGFGEKTRAAVLDYQRKNGLRVDGVAGSETMGSLLARLTPATSGPSTSGQVLSGVSDETMSRMRQLEKGYTPSDEVTAARALWESLQGQKPGEYESRFQQQLAALYDQISSRKPYAYDPEQDADCQRNAPLYQEARTGGHGGYHGAGGGAVRWVRLQLCPADGAAGVQPVSVGAVGPDPGAGEAGSQPL